MVRQSIVRTYSSGLFMKHVDRKVFSFELIRPLALIYGHCSNASPSSEDPEDSYCHLVVLWLFLLMRLESSHPMTWLECATCSATIRLPGFRLPVGLSVCLSVNLFGLNVLPIGCQTSLNRAQCDTLHYFCNVNLFLLLLLVFSTISKHRPHQTLSLPSNPWRQSLLGTPPGAGASTGTDAVNVHPACALQRSKVQVATCAVRVRARFSGGFPVGAS